MLSRTADHLYWMSRYTERAKNTARMLDVNYQMSLLPQAPEEAEQAWQGVLGISELTAPFRERGLRLEALVPDTLALPWDTDQNRWSALREAEQVVHR